MKSPLFQSEVGAKLRAMTNYLDDSVKIQKNNDKLD